MNNITNILPSITPETIGSITNITLIGLFIAAIVFGLIFAILSFAQGIFRTTSRLVVFLILLVVAVCTLTPFSEFLGSIPLGFLPIKTIILNSPTSSVTYNVPITTFSGTTVALIKGYYLLYGIVGNPAVASEYALALSYTVVKTVTFAIDMILILTVGFISEIILWYTCIKRLVPKLARRRIKWRVVSTLEGITLFALSTFLLISPFSSIANSISGAYKKHNKGGDTQVIQYVDSFVNTYNDSVFAKTFMNWTVADNGLTLDANVMNALTAATLENTAVGISDTVYSLTSIVSIFSNSFFEVKDEDGVVQSTAIDYSTIVASETILELFDCLRESNLLTAIIPIAAEMAMNKDLFESFMSGFDPTVMQMSDVEWSSELDNIETMMLDLTTSGILNNFIDEEGGLINVSSISATDIIESCLTNQAFVKVEHALQTIDNSTLLSRAIPSVVAWLAENNEQIGKMFTASWDELNDISWGFELSTLLECIHDMYMINPEIVSALINLGKAPSESSGGETSPELLRADEESEGEKKNALSEMINLIMQDIDSYKRIIIGETDGNNEPINVDVRGRTIVYENGKKISGRRFCIFDLFISKYLLSAVLDNLPNDMYSPDGSDLSAEVHDISEGLKQGTWMRNYKKEFSAVFYSLSAFKDYPDVVSSLLNGESIVPPGKTVADIEPNVIKAFTKALPRMDKSQLMCAIVLPNISSVVLSDDVKNQLASANINRDLVELGIERAKQNHTLGYELAKLTRAITKLPDILDTISSSGLSSAEMIERIGENSENIAYCLDSLYSCRLINPTIDEQLVYEGTTYRVNENYYNLLNFIFGGAVTVNGLSFKEEEMTPNIVWENSTTFEGEYYRDRHGDAIYTGENGNIANVLTVLADSHIMEIIDDPTFFTNNANLGLLAKENGYNLPGILKAVNESKVFSATMGDFLDATLADLQIVGQADVTFNNVTDWNDEGVKLGKVLTEIGKAEVNLSNLNFTEIKDIVGFNNMLHALVDSNIFIKKDDGKFLFGDWLFVKFTDSTNGLDDVFDGYSLVKDPDHAKWNEDWENYTNYVIPPLEYDNYRILYNDLHGLSKDEWYSSNFTNDFNTNNYIGSEFAHYYDNDNFYTAYKDILREDEIGHLCELIYWSQKALSSGEDVIKIPTTIFDNLLDSINRSKALRIGVYNIFEIAKETIRNDANASQYFDLSPAYSTYLINCNRGMSLFEESYVDRQREIDYLKNVIDCYQMMTGKGVLDVATGTFFTDRIDTEFAEELRQSIKGLNQSLVFHRKGSILRNPDDTTTYYPTVFQNMISAFFLKTDFKDILYSASNPKDIYQSNIAHLYEPSVESKVDYLMQTYFDWEVANDTLHGSEQIAEIDRVFEVINAIVGGPKSNGLENYTGLKKFDAERQIRVTTFSFSDFDIGYTPNIKAIREILTALNNTETLYDAVPNSVYVCLTQSNIVTQFSSLNKIHFEDANLFYHYFDRSNTQGLAPYNWNAKFTDGSELSGNEDKSDIALITNLLQEASYYASESPADHNKSIISAFENFESLNETNIDRLNVFMLDMVDSKVFHSSGPRKTIDPATGNVVYVTANGKTVFQEVIEQFLSGEHISANIYNTANPKDFGITLNEKIENVARTVFSYETTQVFNEKEEITYLTEFLRSALTTFETTNIQKFSFDDTNINGDELVDFLTIMNNSECLHDCVSNILYKTFNTESLEQFGSSVDLSTIEPFYIYTRDSSTPNYNAKYPQEELNNIGRIIDAYKEFVRIVDGDNINDLHVIKSLVDEGSLYELLASLHDSEMIQKYNSRAQRTTVDNNLTAFEQAIYYITNKSGIDTYTYGPVDAEARTIAKIENVTLLEQTSNSVNNIGYHTKWNSANGFDELHAFVDFVKVGQEFMGETGTLDFTTVGFDSKNPQSIGRLMKALNKIDFLSDSLPVFIKDGFIQIGLTSLSTYNDVDYAYYNLSQYDFGGRNLDDGVYEIDYIVDALENLYIRENNISSLHYANLNNIVELSRYCTDFNGVMELLQLGKIFNTNLDGQYNVMNQVGGLNISGRGLMIYGVLDSTTLSPDEGAHLSSYITGDNKLEKVATLSKIFTFETGYNYLTESIGLHTISMYSSTIDQTNLNLNDFDSVASAKEDLDIMLKDCYRVGGLNSRSYFASEIMSGLLDELMAKECAPAKANISPVPMTFGPQTIGTDCANVVENAYTNLDSNECNGIIRALEVYEMIIAAGTTDAPTRTAFINKMSLLDNGNPTFPKVIWNAELNGLTGGTNDAFATGFTFSSIAGPVATLLGLN